jgi:hypothetical protein
MIDLYVEAKRREQVLLHEASIRRLLKSAEDRQARGRVGLRNQIISWLGGSLEASGARLRMQPK